MKIKSATKTGKDFHYKWSTHQPVVKAMVALVSPELVLELGVGRYSTPMFTKFNVKKIIHIDSDAGWLELVQKENASTITSKSEFRYHDLSTLGINSIKTLPKDLTAIQQHQIDEYYTALASEIKAMPYKSSLIFTDGFASCRQSTVNCLTRVTDVMIFHDAEHPLVYGYDCLDPKIYETHNEYLLKTATSWTGFLIKKGIINFDTLSFLIDQQVNEYINNLGIAKDGFELIQMNKL